MRDLYRRRRSAANVRRGNGTSRLQVFNVEPARQTVMEFGDPARRLSAKRYGHSGEVSRSTFDISWRNQNYSVGWSPVSVAQGFSVRDWIVEASLLRTSLNGGI